VPLGSGLSSSAALEVCTYTFLENLSNGLNCLFNFFNFNSEILSSFFFLSKFEQNFLIKSKKHFNVKKPNTNMPMCHVELWTSSFQQWVLKTMHCLSIAGKNFLFYSSLFYCANESNSIRLQFVWEQTDRFEWSKLGSFGHKHEC